MRSIASSIKVIIRNIKQRTKISIEPYQMNSDIRNYLKINLKKKVEKKCNKNGYIDEVYRILHNDDNDDDGKMPPEHLNGNAIYNITYHCRLCLPIENTIIIGQVKLINPDLIVTINGPIFSFIPKDNIDIQYWTVDETYTYKLKPDIKLKIGDYVLVQIINKRINQNDVQIKTIGKLLDFANDKDVKEYFGYKEEESINVDDNFII